MIQALNQDFQSVIKNQWVNGFPSGYSGQDGGAFEVHLDRLASNALAEISKKSPSFSTSHSNTILGNEMMDKKQDQGMSLGDRVLSGLYNTDARYKKFLSYMDRVRQEESIDPLQVIMAQSLWVDASTAIEFTTRAVMKLSSVLDSMLRLQ